MKRILLFILGTLFVGQSFAQNEMDVSLNITPPYSTNLLDYVANFENYSMTLTNLTPTEHDVYFHVSLEGDNGVSFSINANFVPNNYIHINGNESLFLYAEDLEGMGDGLTQSQINYSGITIAQITSTKSIPEGQYTVCVKVLDYTTHQLLAINCDFSFFAVYGEPPLIISPFEGDSLYSEMDVFPIIWMMNLSYPDLITALEYEVKMIDLSYFPNADPEFLMNNAGVFVVLDRTVDDLFYNYNEDGSDPYLIEGHSYAIRVRAIDPFDEVPFQNSGYSEIVTFVYSQGFNFEGLPGDNDDSDDSDNGDEDDTNDEGDNPGDNDDGDNDAENNEDDEVIAEDDNNSGGNNDDGNSDGNDGNSNGNNSDGNNNGDNTTDNNTNNNSGNNTEDLTNGVSSGGGGNLDTDILTGALPDIEISTPDGSCNGQCVFPIPSQDSFQGIVDDLAELKIGYFKIPDFNLTLEENGLYSGTGHVKIDFLNSLLVAVSIVDIAINADGQITSGNITSAFDDADVNFNSSGAQESVSGELGELMSNNTSLSPEMAQELSDYMLTEQMMTLFNPGDFVTLPLGLAQVIPGFETAPLNLNISEISFNPEGAVADIFSSINIPEFGDNPYLILNTSGACITPNGFGGTIELLLNEDIVMESEDEYGYDLKVYGAANLEKTRMVVDCQGIKTLEIHGEIQFPEDILVKDNDGTIEPGQVIGAFAMVMDRPEGQNSQNVVATSGGLGFPFMVNAVIEPFQIKGLTGWTFEVGQTWLDMSSYEDPENINYPDDYPNTDNFMGIYIKNARITPPAEFFKDNTRHHVNIHDLIIDPLVFMSISAENLVAEGEGDIDSWDFTMEHFDMEIFANELISANMNGELTMPLMKDGEVLEYEATISSDSGENIGGALSYEFIVGLGQDMTIPMFIATTTLYDNSRIILEIEESNAATGNMSIEVIAELHGLLSMDSENNSSDQLIDLPISVKIPDVAFDIVYSSTNGFDWSTDATKFEVTVDMPKISGFPITLTDISLGDAPSFPGGLGLNLEFEFNLLEGLSDLNVGTDITIISQLQDAVSSGGGNNGGNGGNNNASSSSMSRFVFEGVDINTIEIDVSMSGIGLDGVVDFVDNNGAKGLSGSIDANLGFLGDGVNVQVDGEFGTYGDPNKSFGTEDYFGYYRLRGNVGFGSVGINLGGIMALYGIGGGIYHNMSMISRPTMSDNGLVPEGESEFVVNQNTFGVFGLGFQGTLGLSKVETFNADLGIDAEFSDGGLDMISLWGEGYFISSIQDRENAPVTAGVEITLLLPEPGQRTFSANFNVAVDIELGPVKITGSGNDNSFVDATFYSTNFAGCNNNGSGGCTYFKLGTYDSRGGLEADLGFVEAGISAYLMVGDDIPTYLPDPPQSVLNILANTSGNLDETESFSGDTGDRSATDQAILETGSGLAFGSAINVTADIKAFLLYAELEANIGFDLNLTDGHTGCGLNGWYAQGQAYASLEGALGINVRFLGKDRKVRLMYLGAAVMLQAGVPAPAYFKGEAAVRYELFAGAIKGGAHFSFEVGDECIAPSSGNGFGQLSFFDSVTPDDNEKKVSVNKTIVASFTIPMDEPFDFDPDDCNFIFTQTIVPYLKSYNLKKESDGSFVSLNPELTGFDNESNKTNFYMYPYQPLEPKTWYVLELKVRAKIEGYNVDYVHCTDGIAEDVKTIRFKTGKEGGTLYDVIVYSYPNDGQKYYLQDETTGGGSMKLVGKQELQSYFPDQSEDGNTDYSYFIKFIPANGGEIIEAPIYPSGSDALALLVDQLENSMAYLAQVVQRGTSNNIFNYSSNIVGISSLLAIDTLGVVGESVYSTAEYYSAADSLNRTIPANETLLYDFVFQTSQFNTLAEKLEDIQLVDTEVLKEFVYQDYTHKVKMHFNIPEQFDYYDKFGFIPEGESSSLSYPPLMKVQDNLVEISYFGAQLIFLSFLNSVNAVNDVQDCPGPLDLSETNIDWKNGDYFNELKWFKYDDLIDESDYTISENSNSFSFGEIITPLGDTENNFSVTFNTHKKIIFDQETYDGNYLGWAYSNCWVFQFFQDNYLWANSQNLSIMSSISTLKGGDFDLMDHLGDYKIAYSYTKMHDDQAYDEENNFINSVNLNNLTVPSSGGSGGGGGGNTPSPGDINVPDVDVEPEIIDINIFDEDLYDFGDIGQYEDYNQLDLNNGGGQYGNVNNFY